MVGTEWRTCTSPGALHSCRRGFQEDGALHSGSMGQYGVFSLKSAVCAEEGGSQETPSQE